jgi:hypothetical protein
LMAASATFALKAGVWFRRGLLLIVSPDSRANLARRLIQYILDMHRNLRQQFWRGGQPQTTNPRSVASHPSRHL